MRTKRPLRYIPLEIWCDLSALTPTADVWSFGVLMWEVFTFAQSCPYAFEYVTSYPPLADDQAFDQRAFSDFLIRFLQRGQRLQVRREFVNAIMLSEVMGF